MPSCKESGPVTDISAPRNPWSEREKDTETAHAINSITVEYGLPAFQLQSRFPEPNILLHAFHPSSREYQAHEAALGFPALRGTGKLNVHMRHGYRLEEPTAKELYSPLHPYRAASTVLSHPSNMSSHVQRVYVPHLGGTYAGYQMPHPYDPKKPTLVLVNSFTTSSDLYKGQYANHHLTKAMNLLAIELLGHGATRTKSEHFTYWDSAQMNLQVMTALGIEKAFVLGTSQGGWVTVRMALLAPDRIEGIIPLGTSMDYESERTRKLGCWDGVAACTGPINNWTSRKSKPDFEPEDSFCNFLIDIGFGKDCDSSVRDFWLKTIKSNYRGDAGRRRARMAAINLRERDGLHGRLSDVVCPVMWLHGTSDVVYSVENAQEEIKLFTNSAHADLVTVNGGQHFLSASHPKEVDSALIEFVLMWHAP